MWYRIPVYGMSLRKNRPPSKSQSSSYELFTQLYTFRGATQSRGLAKKNSEKTKLIRHPVSVARENPTRALPEKNLAPNVNPNATRDLPGQKFVLNQHPRATRGIFHEKMENKYSICDVLKLY